MSYRGRVIQRGPVACYAKPQSIQEQQHKAAELIRTFRIPIYRSYTGPVNAALEEFKALGIIGKFPYASILPASISQFVSADSPVWLQLPVNVTFTASSRIVVPVSTDPVRRFIVVVNLDGASPTVHATSNLPVISPGTTSTNTEDIDESISMVTPTRYVFSSVTGGNTSDVHQFIDLPSPNAVVYCALACTLDQNAVYLPNYYMTYTTSIGPDYFFKTQFT